MRSAVVAVIAVLVTLVWLAPTLAAERNIGLSEKQVPDAAPISERRVALVVGNSHYSFSPLRNPVNDASSMAGALGDLGFEVTLKLDANQKDLQRAIIDFGDALEEGGVGLFYYAGHGIQSAGGNWMLPIDAEIGKPEHIEVEAVGVNRVLARMAGAHNRLNIVILDACRDNPYEEKFRTATTRGLAQMQAPSGTYIAYATAPGSVAADGRGRNSTFTSALLEVMSVPELKLEDVFKRVRASVQTETDGAQVPWTSSSITGDFYFRPPAAIAGEEEEEARPDTGFGALELALWEATDKTNTARGYEDYLKRFPDGIFAGQAQARLEALKPLKETQEARLTPTITPLDSQMVAARNANIRAGPSTSDEKLSTLSRGDEVSVTGRTEDGDWYRIALAGGRIGYVFKNLLEEKRAGAVVGETFRDCPDCPEMVVIPSGSFMMGSPESETERWEDWEGPVHRVSVRQPFALGRHEVTRGQYAAFVRATGRKQADGCWYWDAEGEANEGKRRNWRSPGFSQTERDPVACVNWDDAQAYVKWLSKKTGHAYRLPSEAEWEYAARAGTKTARYWGASADDACGYANGHDRTGKRVNKFDWTIHACDDGYAQTAPVGSFKVARLPHWRAAASRRCSCRCRSPGRSSPRRAVPCGRLRRPWFRSPSA